MLMYFNYCCKSLVPVQPFSGLAAQNQDLYLRGYLSRIDHCGRLLLSPAGCFFCKTTLGTVTHAVSFKIDLLAKGTKIFRKKGSIEDW